MEFYSFVWNNTNIEHIASHNVTPEEVEQVCTGKPLIFTAPSKGKNPVYYVLGRTQAGRYLFAVVIYFGKGKGYVVTARDMIRSEKRRYKQWRNT